MQSTLSSKNPDELRKETRGVSEYIHFNNAGASLISDPVFEAHLEYLHCEHEMGGYETFHKYKDELEGFYASVAKFINCKPKEIAFIENATRAWDMAFYSFPFQEGDVILTSVAEYASNYISYLQLKKRKGIEVVVVPNDEHEQTSVSELEKLINEKTKLISITHIPTNGGLVNPAHKIGTVAQKHGIPYLLDACQSVGQLNVDVKEIGCDFLSATGRKYLRGPRATGFLYVKEEWIERLEPVFLDVHAATWTTKDSYKIREDAKRFENWEQNFAGKYGLKTAIEYAHDLDINWIEARVIELADYKREKLSKIAGITLTDAGEKKCGIVSFFSDKYSPDEIVSKLALKKINLSTSTTFGTRLDMEERSLPGLLRSSVHYYNTIEEIDTLVKELKSMH